MTSTNSSSEFRNGTENNRVYSKKEWESIRPILTQLYLKEGRKLKEVLAILNEDYDFYPTERTLKSRVTEFDIHKNVKEREMLHLFRKMTDANVQDNLVFKIRGIEKNVSDVRRFFKRKAIALEELTDRLPLSRTPSVVNCDALEEIQCDESMGYQIPPETEVSEQHMTDDDRVILIDHFHATPNVSECIHAHQDEEEAIAHSSATSGITRQSQPVRNLNFCAGHAIAQAISSPQSFRQMELLLIKTRDWCKSSIHMTTCCFDKMDAFDFTFINHMDNAAAQMDHDRRDLSVTTYHQAADIADAKVSSSDPGCLLIIYQMLCSRLRVQKSSFKMAMLRYMLASTCSRFGTQHPISTTIETILASMDNYQHMCELAVGHTLAYFQSELGPLHPFSREIAYRYCRSLMSVNKYDVAAAQIQTFLDDFEGCLGQFHYDTCRFNTLLGDCFRYCHRYDDAERKYQESITRSEQLPSKESDDVKVHALQSVIRCRLKKGNIEEARDIAQQCCRMSHQAYSPNDHRALHSAVLLAHLEDTLRKKAVIEG